MILKQFPEKQAFLTLAQSVNVIPVCIQILADMETPVSILQKFFNKRKESFLLESVEGGERWARYSFLGLSAFGTIKIFSEDVEIKTKNENLKIPHNNDPLDVIRKFSKGFIPAQIPELPRFWSGFTGYFAYEMVSFFEDIPVSLPEDTPYAHFIIPDEMIIFDNIKQTLTCLKICYLEKKNHHETIFEQSQKDLDKMLDTIHKPFVKTQRYPSSDVALKPETSAHDYIKGVEKIKGHIVEGDIFQAVYSQPFSCRADVDPILIYRAQRYINPSPYMFFMNFKDLIIAGSSPETMVRLENNIATLRPIAGTRPRGKTEQEDRKLADELLNDEKEKAEHVMLIDLGRNDLGRVAEPGTVQVTDTMVVERYSHVMHLVSNITCDMKKEVDAYDLFKATFPAGTLSGAPKIRAMEIISELENSP
ncbi:MAG: chorismate-binding protein, partial [Proteobacteria bacterium]|nr:chorismate-binding protein [Pseudomonadota bacterium]